MKKTQGFTLIELLVVIAIIGILSSIVIASLNSARTKGSVSAAKGQMAQVRTQAETYFDTYGMYGPATPAGGTACTTYTSTSTNGIFADSVIKQQMSQINQNVSNLTCYAGTNVWALSATLKDGTSYCVDNQGSSKASSTAQSTGSCN